MLNAIAETPRYGRVMRDKDQNVLAVVEERNASLRRGPSEIKAAVRLESDWLCPPARD